MKENISLKLFFELSFPPTKDFCTNINLFVEKFDKNDTVDGHDFFPLLLFVAIKDEIRIFNENGILKKILFISHDATRTGAPILLLNLLRLLKETGVYQISILLKWLTYLN